MKYYFYADEKGYVTCHSPQPMTETKFRETEKENENGELVKVQEPYEVLADGWVEVENPTEDMLENMLWYKCVDGTLIKMEEEKVRELYSGLFPDLQPIPEPTPIEKLQKENTLLKAQVQALIERGEFQDDLIAELAMIVYA